MSRNISLESKKSATPSRTHAQHVKRLTAQVGDLTVQVNELATEVDTKESELDQMHEYCRYREIEVDELLLQLKILTPTHRFQDVYLILTERIRERYDREKKEGRDVNFPRLENDYYFRD